MNGKIETKLTGVPETLLISARARYLETKYPNGIIHDPKIVEILDAIDYDYSGRKEVSSGSQIGTAIRTEILDEQTQVFISSNPEGVVVNLGCGLDTRFYRLDNECINWYDLDLPETIDLRRNFFQETDRYHLIAQSVFDFSWIDRLPTGKPMLFIAEGLLMYFAGNEVIKLLRVLAGRFRNADFLIEAMSPFLARNSQKHPDVKKYNASFKWGIKTGREVNNWNAGLTFVNEWYYFDRHRERASVFLRMMCLLPAFRKMMKIVHLKSI